MGSELTRSLAVLLGYGMRAVLELEPNMEEHFASDKLGYTKNQPEPPGGASNLGR